MRECLHRSLLIPVWIRVPGSPLYQCEMTFVSEYGAELMVHNPFAVPDRFDLLFSPIAQSWRECSIIARRYEAKSIRVSFLRSEIPQGSNGAAVELPRTVGTLIEFPEWRNGAAAADVVIE
jgi:hypothetical protein